MSYEDFERLEVVMANVHLDRVDFHSLRDGGNELEQHKMAERTFNILRPLYGHLADAESAALKHFICDPTPIVSRSIFMVAEDKKDLGIVTVRVSEVTYQGETIAHFTIHLGLHPQVRGETHTIKLLWQEMLRYRLKHPLRRCFIVDTPISAASYCKMYKCAAQIYPTPGNPIPEDLWPLCDSIAKQKGWLPIEGCSKEARFVNRPLTTLSANDARPNSHEYLEVERWFAETTGGVVGSSVMVIVPITVSNMVRSALKQANRFLRKIIKRFSISRSR